MRHVHESPRPVKQMNLDVPEGMEVLVMRLLAKKPEDRYGSAFELVEDLRRAQEGLPPSYVGAAKRAETVRVSAPLAATVPTAPQSFGMFRGRGYVRGKLRWAMAATLAVLLALLGVLVWDLSRVPERMNVVHAVEGGGLGAPDAVSGTGGENGGKGAGSGVPWAGRAGSASAASAPASVPAAAPASASPVPGALPAPGDGDRGAENPGDGGLAAEDQYE